MKFFVASVIVNALRALSGGWMLMLAVGISRAHWLTSLPTLGYWYAVLIVWLLQGVFSPADSGELRKALK